MTLGSLFDGSGTCPLAATMCGITPVWASEIEPFPKAVTEKHFPNVQHLGDIKLIDGAKIPPVDIITFGSPCQNLSIAGNREGLAGKESSLFLEAVRIIKEMRAATNGEYPRFAVWENVFGAFTSSGGDDFYTVLCELWGGQAKSLAFLDLRNGVTQDVSWVNIPPSLGEDWMLNFGESPKDASVSSLSQILEGNAPRKYFLSERACRGILERAERHHKKLHPILWLALKNTIVWNTTSQTADTD